MGFCHTNLTPLPPLATPARLEDRDMDIAAFFLSYKIIEIYRLVAI
jgi:hypothetical protein